MIELIGEWMDRMVMGTTSQNIYIIDTFSILERKGCSSSSGTVYRSRGSFSRQFRIKSFPSSLIFVIFENFISSSTCIATPLRSLWSPVRFGSRRAPFQTAARRSGCPRSRRRSCYCSFSSWEVRERHRGECHRRSPSWCWLK